jgi:hypothetical protein
MLVNDKKAFEHICLKFELCKKRKEKRQLVNFLPLTSFLPELTFSTYPHKLQNLSFNLGLTFFFALKD